MAFVRKNTAGGAAGHVWEAGEVKDVHPLLAEELAVLSPEDYEIVPESAMAPSLTEEVTPEPAAEEPAESEETPVPAKAKRVSKKTETTTETPSAE